MKKLHFIEFINAPVEKVWDTMLGDATYREWSAAFNPGGYFIGDWSEGSKMLFLGPNPEGGEGEGGMVSKIAENRKNEFVSIEHYGFIKDGIEDTTSDEVKKWAGSHENYTFTEKDGGTEVTVDIDVAEEYETMFADMWPKALENLRELSEK